MPLRSGTPPSFWPQNSIFVKKKQIITIDYQFTVQDVGHCVPSVHILVTTLSGSTGPFRLLKEGAYEGLRVC